jgi:hypothetical protein
MYRREPSDRRGDKAVADHHLRGIVYRVQIKNRKRVRSRSKKAYGTLVRHTWNLTFSVERERAEYDSGWEYSDGQKSSNNAEGIEWINKWNYWTTQEAET